MVVFLGAGLCILYSYPHHATCFQTLRNLNCVHGRERSFASNAHNAWDEATLRAQRIKSPDVTVA